MRPAVLTVTTEAKKFADAGWHSDWLDTLALSVSARCVSSGFFRPNAYLTPLFLLVVADER